ncbi:methionine gamma-lyase [Mechercharimyces sp. CAU 1602]|uniref:methionine gamma-lyase n=1 Tax=Mechercharimyces sp. CAU 1602 TaxID=2973933 RepID=UPI0021627141|nr:methionine gamma-lyase [Mechercharimyces sp. CAU 1602]MCS1350694.1 methionine gamma-lyase [Mechercharimyces sp. CAU 1602]
MKRNWHMDTDLVHGSIQPCSQTGAIVPPIYQTSTFVFSDAEQGEQRFAGTEEGYIYTRLGNPTLAMLEDHIAQMEDAEAGVAFSSGMGAISSVLISLLASGDHMLCSDGVYGCTYGLQSMLQEKFKVATNYVDMSDLKQVEQAIKPETKVIFVETPINPTMKIADIAAISRMAHQHGAVLVVDNTFCTGYLQKPIALGADIVVHSATKYIGGHGDVIAGIAVGKQDMMENIRQTTLKDIGGVLSPFDAWLLLRGVRTLAVRMDRHVQNAQRIASYFQHHTAVQTVLYPGLSDHPQHELAKRQMKAAGGVISFRVCGGKEEARHVLDSVKLCKLTVSLGEVSSLIQHPATMTHAVIPAERRQQMGITDNLIRIAVGIEHVDDIIFDLEQALHPLQQLANR